VASDEPVGARSNRIHVEDGSGNLIVGYEGPNAVERAQRFLAWLERQGLSVQRNRRVVAFDRDGTPVTVFPNDHHEEG
jgi:hypothetical protein